MTRAVRPAGSCTGVPVWRQVACAAMMLGACSTGKPVETASRRALVTEPLPAMKRFDLPQVRGPGLPNAVIAADFLDLTFRLESGRALPRFTRFEGPVTVALTGHLPDSAAGDLDRLIARLRDEAGIDVAVMQGTGRAAITVEFVPRARMNKLVPEAACFVVPRVSDWAAFERARRSAMIDWTTLTVREHIAIFIPADTSPQEVRDCLHEELAQALGPLNDLYRLPDSVFNDDNFNAVLTGFDMLILRTTYAPELRSGMTQAQVAAALPGVLARLNPGGGRGAAGAPDATPRAWIDAVETALGPGASRSARRAAAGRAVAIAQAQGWQDARLGFSHFALGRLALPQENALALDSFMAAAAIYRRLPGAAVQIAHVDMQLAAFALAAGDYDAALALVDRNLAPVSVAQNASLLATLLMLKAEALAATNRPDDAAQARRDSLGWARYGYGPETEVRSQMTGIAALAPLQPLAAGE